MTFPLLVQADPRWHEPHLLAARSYIAPGREALPEENNGGIRISCAGRKSRPPALLCYNIGSSYQPRKPNQE
jgi:hypothetical protein